MRPISKEEVNDMLGPFFPRLKKCVTDAVDGYYKGNNYGSVRHIHSTRSAASVCHDHIKVAIRTEFDGVPGVRIAEKRGLFTVTIDGLIVLRFKKFNKNLMSSGINTRQLSAFNLQDSSQLEMDIVPDGLLHVGYVLNSLGTEIKDVYITYRYGKINVWSIPLTNVAVIEEPALFPVTDVPAASRTRKITAKATIIAGGENDAVNG